MRNHSRFVSSPVLSRLLSLYAVHICYCLLLLLGLAFGLRAILIHDYEQEINEIVRTNDQLTTSLEEHVRRSLYSIDEQLLLVRDEFEHSGISPKLATFMERTMRNPIITETLVIDAKGDVVLRVRQGKPFTNLSHRSYFQAHVGAETGKLFISEPIVGPFSDKTLLCLSRRLSRPDGSFAGVVAMALDTGYFSGLYQSLGLFPGQLVRIVGRDGIVRASWSLRLDELGRDISQGTLFQELARAPVGHYRSVGVQYGVDRFMSYRAMDDFPLIVQVGYETDFALADYRNRQERYTIIVAVAATFVFLFTVLAVILSRHRVRAEDALRNLNETLKQRVEEKTQELLATNEELTAMNEEMAGMNQLLTEANLQLEEEISNRQEKEAELVLRNRQYQTATRLLLEPADQTDGLMQTILRDTLQLLGAPEGYIGLLAEDGISFIIRCAIGVRARDIGQPLTALSGLRGQVFATGQAQWVEDYRTYPLHSGNPDFTDLTTFLAFPLWQEKRVSGVLAAYWFDELHPPTPDMLDIMRQYSDLASVALNNAMLHEKTLHLALHDALTGLPNRAGLALYLKSEMERAKSGLSQGAVMFVDLDDLKIINDNYGHSVGDSVIRTAGRHIQATVGEQAFVARIGGDEFVVVLGGVQTRGEISHLAEKLVLLLNQDYEVSGQHLRLTASLGVALYPADGDNAEDLLKKADMAMYAAKTAGKDCWCFYEQHIGEESYERLMLTNSLRRALERDELFLVFQPLIACSDNRISGFEALLRWQSTDHGPVPPDRFIPLAEQSGLILPIGRHVLSESCQFARRLKDMGLGALQIAVNISPRQLADDDFVDSVRECVLQSGIDGHQLELEVTESVFIASMEESIQKFTTLKQFGVGMALDDFGTGYSSLTYLRRLPVDTLKIDKSFIAPILGDESQERFVRYIVEMAHCLNLRVVAEGVEEASQQQKLAELGCDLIQGFVFSRPVPAAETLRLLDEQGRKPADNR